MQRSSVRWRLKSPKSSASRTVSSPQVVSYLASSLPAEYRKVVMNKQKMAEKKSENEMVMQEVKMLDEDANVFKMVGPILAKQSVAEVMDNVQQRINFIEKEVNRLETLETEFQGKITDKTNHIKKMQTDFQRIVMAAQQAQQ